MFTLRQSSSSSLYSHMYIEITIYKRIYRTYKRSKVKTYIPSIHKEIKKIEIKILMNHCFNPHYRLFQASANNQHGQAAKGGQPESFVAFTLNLVEQLLAGYSAERRVRRPSLLSPDADRLTRRCMPVELPSRSWCHVCYERRRLGRGRKSQSKFGCSTCGKHLCLPQCFTKYHMQQDYLN